MVTLYLYLVPFEPLHYAENQRETEGAWADDRAAGARAGRAPLSRTGGTAGSRTVTDIR
jgi:hypothetical protein